MLELEIKKIKDFLPDGTQMEIAAACHTTPITVSRAWNQYQNGRVSAITKSLIFAETAKKFLALYEGEMKETAAACKRFLSENAAN